MLLVGMMNRGRGWHHAHVRGDRDAALNILVRYLIVQHINIITP